MRICMLTTSYPRDKDDDAGIFVKRLAQALSAAGASGSIIVPKDNAEPSAEIQESFAIRRFSYGTFCKGALAFGAGMLPNIRRNPLRILQLPRLLWGFVRQAIAIRGEYDVLHANWLITAPAAWLARKLTGVPYVVTLRGEDMKLLDRRLIRFFFLFFLRRARLVISVNKGFVNELITRFGISPDAARYIPNGVAAEEISGFVLEEFRSSHNIPEVPIMLFIGTAVPRKRVDLLIRLLNESALKDFHLVVCGRTDDTANFEELKRVADSLGCSGRIHFQGKVPPRDVPYYLKLAHCYVTASEFEGRSNSLLEALAAGKIVFASDIPSHRELIVDGENGHIADFAESAALATLIAETLSNKDRVWKLESKARSSVSSYSWPETARSYIEAFKSVA